MKIILYKSLTCPNCKMLGMMLDKKGIEYEAELDLEALKQQGITSIPQLSVDGELMNFTTAVNWVKGYQAEG